MNRMNMRTTTFAVIGSLLFAASCSDSQNGVAAPNDQGQALWTLHANLEGTPSDKGEIHLAFIWSSSHRQQIAEDIALASNSPLTVDLAIYDLPDDSVLTPTTEGIPPQLYAWQYEHATEQNQTPAAPTTLLWAQGKLVLYEDVNGNGKLDLPDTDAAEAVDRIVGAAFNYDFYYIESDLIHPYPNVPEVTTGLNMVSLTENWHESKPISLENDILITLDDTVEAQRLMCQYLPPKLWQDGGLVLGKSCTVVEAEALLSYFPDGVLPEIDGHCTYHGLIFEWFDTYLSDADLCKTMYMHGDYFMASLPADAAVPDWWPCEVSADIEAPALYPYFVDEIMNGNELGVFDLENLGTCPEFAADIYVDFQSRFESIKSPQDDPVVKI